MILALLLVTAPVERWPRPWVVVKLNAEFPYGLGPGVEVMPHDRFSLGADVNFSQAGTFYRVSGHVWPELPSARGAHQFLLGLGGETSVTFSWPPRGAGFISVTSVDMRYLGRIMPEFGFVLGTRLGIGIAWDTTGFSGRPIDHLAVSAIVYAGVAFGARSSRQRATPSP